MPEDELTNEEKNSLLSLAREALEAGVRRTKLPPLDQQSISTRLMEQGASFVTLYNNSKLRGCIGTLEAYQPLAEDVREHTIAAALQDIRFPNVHSDELTEIEIEVSRLSLPVPLEYNSPDDLLTIVQSGKDGVLFHDGEQHATFLPNVWEKLPDHTDFFSNLCYKMNAKADLWRKKHLDVSTFQVERFNE